MQQTMTYTSKGAQLLQKVATESEARRNKIEPQQLYLTANGSFRVLGARKTQFRCGPHKMIRTINYTVKIGSEPKLLDDRGFIIDWQDIFQAVAKRFRYVDNFPSCEKFAAEILALVYSMLGSRCTSLTVDVGINGLPAHMTAEYREA